MAIRKERFEEGHDFEVPKKAREFKKDENSCAQCGDSIFTFDHHREEDGKKYCSMQCIDSMREDTGSNKKGFATRIDH